MKIIYAIDVSEGLGLGHERKRRWLRLKEFLNNVNKRIIGNGNKGYIVYDIEPRYLTSLEPCDDLTEYFVTKGECLCDKKSASYRRGETSCSTHSPTKEESVDDWGAEGPRTGVALEMAKRMFNEDELKHSKKLVVLVTHRSSADDVTAVENDLKDEGISLVDIEIGDRHNLRKRSKIPQRAHGFQSPYEKRSKASHSSRGQSKVSSHHDINKRSKRFHGSHVFRSSPHTVNFKERLKRSKLFDEIIPRDHQMEVSFQKLDKALSNIFTKLCDSQSVTKTRRSRIYVSDEYIHVIKD